MINPISTPIPSDSTVELSQESPEDSTDPAQSRSEARVPEEREFVLPEPDPEQIAVLTNKLPDTPILPWNHYDSPWREEEEEPTEEVSVASELEAAESEPRLEDGGDLAE
ncbi:hypothetical protein [Oscillatoria sp. FACHB-1406]|uniref:hypothetical protein n=1 Tax=Oscillatoria sp. FACHB-1406 TaxID=2692846 RepID=UPI0016890955|nr:hypothetical protein [Oscillatoria sp. FACHB-1406]MBD2580382.1 hypothetical protein [Oscillatoria sp. FACHB-1406]